MKFIAKHLIWVLFFALMIANAYVFISGVHLSDELSRYDSEITRLDRENLDLEKKLFSYESLNHAASIAAELNFTNAAPPIYLDEQTFALNR
jgi:hypothetical protein